VAEAVTKLALLSLIAGIGRSFLITELTELILAWLLGVRDRRGMLLVFLANLMTNPAAVTVFMSVRFALGSRAAAIAAIPIEIAVLLSEWRLYFAKRDMLDTDRLVFAKPGTPDSREIASLLLALVLNIASYGTGALIGMLGN